MTIEIMLAFSLLILFTISTFDLASSVIVMKKFLLKTLESLEISTQKADKLIASNFDDLSGFLTSKYGNHTNIFRLEPLTITSSNYAQAWGRDNCNPRLTMNLNENEYFSEGLDIGFGNASTDIEVRNGIAYLTADSATANKDDLFIVDTNDDNKIISSLNTGPGIAAIEVVGPYLFLAQASTINQLQIVDIHDKSAPQLISQLKLSLPTPTSTAPFARSIFYDSGYVYVGTEKWNGAELTIIDVTDVYTPNIVGNFETSTLINDIYIKNNIAYLATADQKQMRVLDVADKTDPVLIDSFSPTGWQTQEGRILEYFEEELALGRTVGGFNVVNNHEVFIFSTSTEMSEYISKDIPGGVYGMLIRNPYIFLLTHHEGKELQIYNSNLSTSISEIDLDSAPVKMVCDLSNLYFATGDSKGLSILKFKNE